jgi:hypothetical protein
MFGKKRSLVTMGMFAFAWGVILTLGNTTTLLIRAPMQERTMAVSSFELDSPAQTIDNFFSMLSRKKLGAT